MENEYCLTFLIPKIIEAQDCVIGKGRRHCWTQCKFMGPFFDIAAFRSTFGARIFHERYIYIYSTRIQNRFLSPIYLLNSNTGVRIRSIFGMLVIWLAF